MTVDVLWGWRLSTEYKQNLQEHKAALRWAETVSLSLNLNAYNAYIKWPALMSKSKMEQNN